MSFTTIREPPAMESFTPLAEHQSQTPTSFYGAKPVLHFHIMNARASGKASQRDVLPILQPLPAGSPLEDAHSCTQIDIYVSSESLTLFNNESSVGMSISYPSISLHAIQRLQDPSNGNDTNDLGSEVQALYMQLSLAPPSEDDEEPPETELLLLPPLIDSHAPPAEQSASFVKALFEAVSACADLHPDPQDEDSDEEMGDSRIVFEGNVGYEGISGLPGAFTGVSDGGLPPPFPGSGGWITAENVGEYFDEDGNYIAGEREEEVLGEGAGRVRGRDEIDDDEEPEVNGHGEDGEENKRARVE